MTESSSLASNEKSPLRTGAGAQAIAPGLWVLHGQGQSFVAETSAGLVVIGAGSGGKVTDAMITALRTCSGEPAPAPTPHATCSTTPHAPCASCAPRWYGS